MVSLLQAVLLVSYGDTPVVPATVVNQITSAAQPTPAKATSNSTINVRLRNDGALYGRVYRHNGDQGLVPVAGGTVNIAKGGSRLHSVRIQDRGYFTIPNFAPGVYSFFIEADGGIAILAARVEVAGKPVPVIRNASLKSQVEEDLVISEEFVIAVVPTEDLPLVAPFLIQSNVPMPPPPMLGTGMAVLGDPMMAGAPAGGGFGGGGGGGGGFGGGGGGFGLPLLGLPFLGGGGGGGAFIAPPSTPARR